MAWKKGKRPCYLDDLITQEKKDNKLAPGQFFKTDKKGGHIQMS